MDPQKLKVVELRAELSKRGIDSKGNKPVLVERLLQALKDEKEEPKAQVDQCSDNEEEPAKLPPRTPSRSSRHTSREPTTPARTPTRRSSSRSSLSRQSPAKTMLAEGLNEAASALEPIVEEEKASPKKDNVDPLPKKETAPATPKKETPAVSLAKDAAPATTTPMKEATETTPKKENIAQNESPKAKKDDNLDVVEAAEQHVPEKSQEITRKSIDEACNKPVNVQSPVKTASQSSVNFETQSPVKAATGSPAKPVAQSPAKSVTDSPAKPAAQSPAKPAVQSPAKPATHSPSKPVVQSPDKAVVQSPTKPTVQSPAKPTVQSPAKPTDQSPVKPETEQSPVKPETKQSPVKPETKQSPVKSGTPQKVEQSPIRKDAAESPNNKVKNDALSEENILEEESKKDTPVETMEVDENDAKPMETDDQQSEKDSEEKSEEKSEDRKRKRSPSPQEEAPRAPPIARPENEPTYDNTAVLLSWYDSDLNLVIDTTNYFSGSPMQGDGFNYMWAGVRASHGFNKGKVFFEARINKEFDNMASAAGTNASGAIPADEEKIPCILRVGWSAIGSSLQLGEDKLSYGYEGTGKKSTNKQFSEYGKTFSKHDVVGCYADFETDGNVTLSYTVNGEEQGPAFVLKKEELQDKALYPHVLSKNCSFTVNLGQEDPWSSKVLNGYTFVGKVDLNDRISGPCRPEKREDCEVILLCGLPFSGKTTWALKHVAKNPDKMYSVLGTHNLIERMTVDGGPLKDNFKGRWENIVEKCTRALTKLLESAPSRRRNYILDQQANVYGSAQRRKMRNFYGFHRKAVVLVPSDEEFKSRIAKRKQEADGEEIRESSILEVKANINAPVVGESFEEVEWAELGEEEGKKLIENYNTEGKTAGYGQSQQQLNKRSRIDNGQKDRSSRDSRDHRRSGFNDRRSSGSWRGGPGGWREGGRMRGGPMRHGGGYGSPGTWRGRGASPLPQPRTGANDRRQGNDRNRSSGRGWNAMGYQGGNQHGNAGVWSSQGSWQAQGQSQAGWTGQQSATGGNWNQQQAWGGAAGSWKGYGQNSYGQSAVGYGQTGSGGYGNGNWGSWGPQYYSQYWGSGQQQTGQTGGSSGSTQAPGQSAGKK